MVGVKPTPRLPPPGKAGIRRPPVERLASLKRPNPTPIRRPQSIHVPQNHQQQQQQQQAQKSGATVPPKTSKCPNPSCPDPNIVEDDGQKVCAGCGTVISESNIVSEVTFGEASSGAAIVQGTFVGADQSHGRSFGPGFQRGGGIESREITEQNGNRYIAQLSRALNIPESASKAGGQVFKLAVGLNFIQGRRTKTVAAVALYIACRRQDGNTVMLIDFADVLMINVFKLGRAYKALLDELKLGGNHFIMNPIDPESLIYRFSKQLEFGPAMMQVASEAVRIVQRMNRDWMITGRRPAGICGAALILAARMNNFRRTVREVVYVVKVTELTIHQRLNEFKATESGGLTVDEFRSVQLETCHDPPSFSHSKDKKATAQGKKRKAAEVEAGVDAEQSEASLSATQSKAPRVDADGFAIPEIPIDPALLSSDKQHEPSKNVGTVGEPGLQSDGKRTRPKGSRNAPYPEPTESELASESALEDEMTALLSSSSDLVTSTTKPATETTNAEVTTQHTSTTNGDNGTDHQNAETNTAADDSTTPPQTQQPVSSDIEINPLEFEDDPEVQFCLLSPAEVEIKERIWVHENKDYLRTQQAKALRKALAEAGSDPSRSGAHRPRKRRKGRIGDVTYLSGESKNADGESVAGSRASTPAEATRLMLERRGFSKKINYQLFEQMYGDNDEAANEEGGNIITVKRKDSESDGSRRSRSRSVSVSRSVRGSSIASEGGGIFGGRASGNRSKLLKPIRTPVKSTMKKPAVPAVAPASTSSSKPAIEPTSKETLQPSATPTAASNKVSTAAKAAPAPAPAPAKQQPQSTDPNEEILGYLPDAEEDELPAGAEDVDEDDEEEEDEEEEDDGVEAAFAGNYYDEGSDGGYDDDYF
ncbi:transcription factor TFIIIB complex subunit brf1 [Nannizzia gypsea CBS 118893]|uniref:B-related factor 1 n=1 Tax=Arthroderma gypseum (strain ATCC MYA-4604 / CBS 118893) TaxID=535722 RepID=E5R1V4_ARTGP|nr:transcription factor TFIIIB complex subunit brf1 [Nannizzia gypsea CBS 118893]EFQ98588.1 transcription factor TFIIIB complex subunit brf1 [Nannizzia gypsea CBS 118893]